MRLDEAILRHLRASPVRNQAHLMELLHSDGFRLTVSTLSRHCKKLGVHKVAGVYRPPEPEPCGPLRSLRKVAPCLLILKTLPGQAQALAVALDAAGLAALAGSVSGYDTIFLAPVDSTALDALEAEVRRHLGR